MLNKGLNKGLKPLVVESFVVIEIPSECEQKTRRGSGSHACGEHALRAPRVNKYLVRASAVGVPPAPHLRCVQVQVFAI